MPEPEAEALERLLARAPARRGHDPEQRRRSARALAARGAWGLTPDEPRYPPALRDLPDPPAVLFGLGAPPPHAARAVAVVGARAASDYGRRTAGRLAAELARLGYVVVSGLARGIDAAAHEAALDAGGETIAVLPSGLDHVVPGYHEPLARRIASRGCLLSETGAGPPPFRGAFVKRNRVIAALAAATVVVEAGADSGALRTAEAARALGRAVLAVPGDVDREGSRGCHALLRAGAALCESVADVLAAMPRGSAAPMDAAAMPASPLARVRGALDASARPAESVAARAGLPIEVALSALLQLEWSGLAARRPGGAWCAAGEGRA